ncbi:MAG: prenyltransferase/squalene oxidase repeat-containing protein [Planctomycetota bacterium]
MSVNSTPERTSAEIAHQWSSARDGARRVLNRLRTELIQSRSKDGYWTGELAASSLSTATAVSALAAVPVHADECLDGRQRATIESLVVRGSDYLCGQQNHDGGFGDTDRSHSNIATSYLVLSASTLAARIGVNCLSDQQLSRLERYIDRAGALDGLRARYGKDKTFVVPIMNNMAIAGLISWDEVAALPFEAAVFPQSMYRFLRMPVVSYAIPALVAIGQARHFLGRKAFWPVRLFRALSVKRTLDVLLRMQPESGGYLEATPLTAFVVMSLAATGRCNLQVVRNGIRFLEDSVRDDGSWPIDTNLATWVTSLSIHALSCDPEDSGEWYSPSLLDWHLGCQHRRRHPFTGAESGGWGWTNLSGAVPDGDDTPAAMLALDCMKRHADPSRREAIERAMRLGAIWLQKLQNRDGGWPTFCRGWGKLPFDRSSTDLTAHAMRAFRRYPPLGPRPEIPTRRGMQFLRRQQLPDGSWLPLWFGNQDRETEDNPVYGTAKVLISGLVETDQRRRAVEFLLECQNEEDGGWGGGPSLTRKLREFAELQRGDGGSMTSNSIPTSEDDEVPRSSIEETGLAVEALCRHWLDQESGKPLGADVGEQSNGRLAAAILGGVEFLVQGIDRGRHHFAWPIGFYFAKLWYHERLYPPIFATAALGTFLSATMDSPSRHLPG